MSSYINNILICGDRSVGKSTLIKKVISEIKETLDKHRLLTIRGFFTEMETDSDGLDRIYLNPTISSIDNGQYQAADKYRIKVGERDFSNRKKIGFPSKFDEVSQLILNNTKDADLIVIDELGVLESEAHAFQKCVFALFESAIPVIAAVRNKKTPFLKEIMLRSDSKLFVITPENRNAIYPEILIETTAIIKNE